MLCCQRLEQEESEGFGPCHVGGKADSPPYGVTQLNKLVFALVGLAIVVASLLYWDQYADANALAADALYNSACIYDAVTDGASALDNTQSAAAPDSAPAPAAKDCGSCPGMAKGGCGGCGSRCQHSS